MLGFQPVSAAPFSASAKVTHAGTASLSSAVTHSFTITQLGTASLGTGGAFAPFAFSSGFQGGISLSGTATITQELLGAVARLVADGTIERSTDVLLSVNAVLRSQHAIVADLKSIGSLTGNSVLLIGGVVNLAPLAAIDAVLVNTFDNADQVDFTLYLDKIKEFSSYIDSTRSITSYIDKQRAITLYVDEILSPTSYIDKQRSFDLIREK